MKYNIKFTEIAPNEVKFNFKGQRFILGVGSIGVYGSGRAIRLYQLDGVKKEFVKCVGWMSTDNHGSDRGGCITPKEVTMATAKTLAVDYLDKLLS